MNRLFLFLLILILPIAGMAGGFQIYLQGQRQIGMGLTGVGTKMDAATISLNPGGLALLRQNNIYGGGSLILSNTHYRAEQPSEYSAYMEQNISTPFNFYANYGLMENKKLQLGLGIYTPFGSGASWGEDWKGRFVIQDIALQTIYIQPTVAYAINDKIGIGAGLIIARGNFSLQRAIPITDNAGNEGMVQLDGSAMGYGFNAGIYFQPVPKFSVGVDFRSNVTLGVEDGTAEFTIANSLKDSFPANTFSSEISLPYTASIGFGIYPSDKLTLALDINYTGWSVYDTLSFDFTQNTSLLDDSHLPKEYENSYAIRLGAEYKMTEKLAIRAGGYFDNTPVQDGFLSPETPDSDRIGLTLGLGFTPVEKLNIDASFLFIEGSERTGRYEAAGFGGTYKTRVYIPGLSVQYSF